LTARILDPATADAPSDIYTAADPYLTTGGIASTTHTTHHHHESGLASSTGLGSSSGLGSSTMTSDPYSSSGSRDPMSSSNMTSTTGSSHHHHDNDSSSRSGGGGMVENLKEKLTGHSNTSGSHGTQGSSMGNDSSRDTGMSGFSTGNPNQGGDTRVPTEEFGNSGSSNYGSSTIGRAENRAEQAIDSRVDASRSGHGTSGSAANTGGKHGISGLFSKETNKLHKEPPSNY